MAKTIKIWTAIIHHQHGVNTYVAASQGGIDEHIAVFCRDWWGEAFDVEVESAAEFEAREGRDAMISAYFARNNELGGSESCDIEEHDLELPSFKVEVTQVLKVTRTNQMEVEAESLEEAIRMLKDDEVALPGYEDRGWVEFQDLLNEEYRAAPEAG